MASSTEDIQLVEKKEETKEEEPKPRSSTEIVTAYHEAKQRSSTQIDRIPPPEEQDCAHTDIHSISLNEAVARHNTDLDHGLSSKVAAERLEINGFNELTPPEETPEWVKFMQQMTSQFALLLWVGCILSLVGYALDQTIPENLYIGIVLGIVVLLTGTFSYYQERKSSDLMSQFAEMMPDMALVLRDGEYQSVNARELVVGDIVKVKAGDKVVADLRLIETDGMKVDNSSLTGESEPQSRGVEFTDPNPYETRNLAFYSTLCVKGSAVGMVVFTGDRTIIGQIAGLAGNTDNVETPIHREIEHFIRIISSVAIFLGVTFFFIGVGLQTPIITNLVFMIGIIVANVPEGLLATVTVSLTLTANRMAQKQVLVKNLESVETLGSTTHICSDKTGTLTQNKMTLAHLFYDGQLWDSGLAGHDASYNSAHPTYQSLKRIAALCNNATYDPTKPKLGDQGVKQEDVDAFGDPLRQKVNGDASETALLRFVQVQENCLEMRKANPKVFEVPFNSSNKYQISVHTMGADVQKSLETDSSLLLVMKGAPERIFDRCDKVLVGGKVVDKGEEEIDQYNEAYTKLGGDGERVLGFCHRVLPAEITAESFADGGQYDEDNMPLDDLVFVGLLSLIDPPRPEVPPAVRECQSAGIKVIMVTGDHPLTAAAIAKQVGIIDPEKGMTREDVAKMRGVDVDDVPLSDPAVTASVVHGKNIPDLDTTEKWDEVLDKPYCVFARTSPEQKLIIVENNQRRKAVVAVTGDGVNDSPALKKADIGVAMGITGSAVSKEAADMILLNDNFASIVDGVEEGRLIFDNLKKSIAYTLSSNIPEIAPFLLFIVIGIPLPLPTQLILCVDLGTDMIPAISMAYETKESDIMDRPPRDADKDKLVTSRLISFSYLQIGIQQALAGFYTYMVVLGDYGIPPWLLPGAGLYWDNESVLIGGINAYARDDFLRTAHTAYFVTIVVVQWADLLICKTRLLSIFDQGMKNGHLNFGLFSETALAALLCYVPFVNQVFLTRPILFVHWLPGLPFSIVIFIYDEVRKMLIRKNRGGWLEQKTYY